MKTCAVIVAAYKAEKYINQCIRSIESQKLPDGWQIDIRVGVDGCEETAKVIKGKYYYSFENVGAYVMRNSLIYQKQADVYSYFDADDIMKQGYLKKVLNATERHSAVMTAKTNTDEKLNSIKDCFEKGGAITFTHKILTLLGGYKKYRCACDTDFMERIEMSGICILKIDESLYFRRSHKGQLTKVSGTHYGSDYRKKSWAEMTEQREAGEIKIEPVLQNLELIENENEENLLSPVYILIRTSGRPAYFSHMMESVKKQTYKNIITIVHTDNWNDTYIDGDIIIRGEPYGPETGTAPYNLYCNTLLDSIPSDGWYCFLDDDDFYEDAEIIEKLVNASKRECINVGKVNRYGSIWPRKWKQEKSFQTECFLLHTDHKDLARWWANKAGDHYYTRQLTKQLTINWIDDIIICSNQTGKGYGLRMDREAGDCQKKIISRCGARHNGPPVEVEYLRKDGSPGEKQIVPFKYAKRLEKIGKVKILKEV